MMNTTNPRGKTYKIFYYFERDDDDSEYQINE
jgi:hypothetical protein